MKIKCAINVGNAGTIARFLTCFLLSKKENLVCISEAAKRPMELLNCLEDLGCNIKYQEKRMFPFHVIHQWIK